jgi:hypothetical protein
MRLATLFLPIALLGNAGCESATSPSSNNLDGKWGALFNGNPGGSSINLTLTTARSLVSGSGAVCGIGPACSPGTVSVTGRHVPGLGAFSLVLSGGGHSIAYTGQFKGPDTLVGTWAEGSSAVTVTLGRCGASSFCW